MPTYEYECVHCHKIEERRVSVEARDTQFCPCSDWEEPGAFIGHAMRRREVYPVGIAFRGPGFYVTDTPERKAHAPAKED